MFADAARPNEFLNALPAAIYLTDADGADHLFQRGGSRAVGPPAEAQHRSVVRLVAAVLARRHADAARCLPHGDHLEGTPRGARRPGHRRAARRQPRAVHGVSHPAARRLRRLRRRRQHADRHERAPARRAGVASSRRDRRIVRRRHHQQGPQRRDRHLEQGRRAAVRLSRAGGHRQADHDVDSRTASRRRDPDPGTHPPRRTHRSLRDRAPAQGWQHGLDLAHGVADHRRLGPHRRRLEDRPRHHRAEAPRRTDQPARPRGRPPHQEPLGAGASHGASHQRRDGGRAQERDRRPAARAWPMRIRCWRNRAGPAPTCAIWRSRNCRPTARKTMAKTVRARGSKARA